MNANAVTERARTATAHWAQATTLLSKARAYRRARLERIEHLAGDGSGRRYFRLHLDGGGKADSVVMVLLSHEQGPVTHGGEGLNQDDTFVALSSYFNERGINVPTVEFDGRADGALLVEDVGDLALWRFAFASSQGLREDNRRLYQSVSAQGAMPLYEQAIDVIAQLQACPVDEDCVAFGRSMTLHEYRVEARRFIDHHSTFHEFDRSRLVIVADFLDGICESVAGHRRTLMHRDFMPWNIHVTDGGRLAILDFQDALVGSYVYDLISLVHDRDADFALGDEGCQQVVTCFKKRFGLGDEFYRHYCEALLQRYLRLAGQFHLLTKKTGRPMYERWVPGCLRRIGRTLVHLPEYATALEVLCDAIPEVRQGAEAPWVFPQ